MATNSKSSSRKSTKRTTTSNSSKSKKKNSNKNIKIESISKPIDDLNESEIEKELTNLVELNDVDYNEVENNIPIDQKAIIEKAPILDNEVQIIHIRDLKGVGPAIATKLEDAGYNSAEAIAVASPSEISGATGIGETVCAKIIQSARSQLKIGFKTANEVLSDRQKIIRFTTGSKELDGILGGGIETRSIVEAFGEFRTGKTQIAHQLCVTVQLPTDKGGLNGAVCYIDTEGTFRPERLLQILDRYDFLDKNKVLDNVIYCRAYNSDHQQLIVEKLAPIIKEKNIRLIIVDSIISHFRSEYIGRGTLSDRQQKLSKFLHRLLQLAEAHNLTVYITNQVQSSPGVFFGDPTKPTGGNVLAHASTFRLYLRKSKANKRVARLIDSPCLPEAEAIFSITEHGIED
ncbi:MAG: DNA repair and recombination protein RadA [Candidatus Helarchaeota archaeon]